VAIILVRSSGECHGPARLAMTRYYFAARAAPATHFQVFAWSSISVFFRVVPWPLSRGNRQKIADDGALYTTCGE